MDYSDLIHVRKAAASQAEYDRATQRDDQLAARMQDAYSSAFHPRNRELCVRQMQSVPPCLAEAIAAEIFKARLATSNQQLEIQQAYAAAARMLETWLEDECAADIQDGDLDQRAEY